MNKKIILLVVLLIIVGSIFYLESIKVKPTGESNVQEIEVERVKEIPPHLEEEMQEKAMPDMQDMPQKITLTQEDLDRIEQKSKRYPRAIELVGTQEVFNTDDIRLADLVGDKIIIVDFWTYSCINCQRTLPYLTAWYENYNDKGLVIVGVHTPEFAFEKDRDNLQRAIEKFGVTYPVVQDNDYVTWRAYKNRYWPRKYVIDIDGFIVFDHIGEGAYGETEAKILALLREREQVLGIDVDIPTLPLGLDIPQVEFTQIGTPEIYFGYGFTRGNFGNSEGFTPEADVVYVFPSEMVSNKAYVDGTWTNHKDDLQLVSEAGKIELTYTAKVVNLVAGAQEERTATIFLDGAPITTTHAGSDVDDGGVQIKEHDLYNLVDSPDYETHTILIEFDEPGVQVFTFTFG